MDGSRDDTGAVDLRADSAEVGLRTQIVRFVLTGGFSAIVDQGLNLLLHFVLGVGTTPAKALSFIAGTTVAYLINRRWTFAAEPSRARFAAVVALYATTFAVQVFLYKVLYDTFDDGVWWSTVAFVIAQGTATVINFIVQRMVIFRMR